MNSQAKSGNGVVLGGRRRSDRDPTIAKRDFRRPAPPTGDALRELRMLCSRYSDRMREALSSHIRVKANTDVQDAVTLPYGEALTELADDCWFIPLRSNTGERAVLVLDDALQRYLINRLLGWKAKEPEEDLDGEADSEDEVRPPPPIGEISRSALRPFVGALLRRISDLLRGRKGGKGPDAAFTVDLERFGQPQSRLMRGVDLMVRFSTVLREGEDGGALTLLAQQESIASLLHPEDSEPVAVERREINQRVERVVRSIGLGFSARLGGATVDLGEFGRLAPGDVLVLDRRMSEPVEVVIGDRVEFLARPGRSRGRLAVHITERTEAKEPS